MFYIVDIGAVEGLAFDENHRDLYFTSLSERAIMRISMSSDVDLSAFPKKATPVLRLSKSDSPRGIAVDPCSMLVLQMHINLKFIELNRIFSVNVLFAFWKRKKSS